MKYFTVTHRTTREDLRRQRNELAKQLHTDRGLAGCDEEFKVMQNQYEEALKNVLHFELLRGTDEHGKAFLHGLAEYIIDRGLEHFFPLTEPPKLLKTLLQVYKDEAIENMNISEVLAKIEQKIKQNRRF